MNFSVYTTSSTGAGAVYANSTVIDNSWGCSHSNYSTNIRIQSPTGRLASGQSTGLQASASLPINGEFGDYQIVTTGAYQCSCINWGFAGFGGGQTLPVCPRPVNFGQASPPTIAPNYLRFYYGWQSSTGNLADLQNCRVGERVDFYGQGNPFYLPAPFPPDVRFDNPEIHEGAGSEGTATDTITLPTQYGFLKPYFPNAFVGTQVLRYACPCQNGGGYVTLQGPLPINFAVAPNANGTYKFTITKDGAMSTMSPLP